jgi:hypothetical protein
MIVFDTEASPLRPSLSIIALDIPIAFINFHPSVEGEQRDTPALIATSSTLSVPTSICLHSFHQLKFARHLFKRRNVKKNIIVYFTCRGGMGVKYGIVGEFDGAINGLTYLRPAKKMQFLSSEMRRWRTIGPNDPVPPVINKTLLSNIHTQSV